MKANLNSRPMPLLDKVLVTLVSICGLATISYLVFLAWLMDTVVNMMGGTL